MTMIEGVGDEVTVVAALLMFIFVVIATFLYQNFSLEDFLDATWDSFPFWRQVPNTGGASFGTAAESHGNQNVVNDHANGNVSEAIPVSPLHPSSDIPRNTTNSENNRVQESDPGLPTVETTPNTDTSNDVGDPSAPQADRTSETEPNQTTNELNGENIGPLPPNTIRVRLKFMNDTERIVTTQLSDTVGFFKRTHFATDLAANKNVRLIFNGQVLQDNVTLSSCRIEDRTVLHVLITQPQVLDYSTTAHSDLDISSLMWPLFSILLGVGWVMYIRYPEFFSMTSVVILVAFSGSFLVVYVHSQVQVR